MAIKLKHFLKNILPFTNFAANWCKQYSSSNDHVNVNIKLSELALYILITPSISVGICHVT